MKVSRASCQVSGCRKAMLDAAQSLRSWQLERNRPAYSNVFQLIPT